MEERSIYIDIAQRTQGDIYIGVVGPVRTGKSTFIKQFMDTLVIPNIVGEAQRARAMDELPQSASGRTIMTTEPKFIPEEAVEINLPGNAKFRVRMIDCVGYIVPSALGYIEEDQPRMVTTPWYEEEIPFNMAAEIGTRKVISEHSTIGLVITTDGSISEIPRDEYAEAEERVINELRELNKPFVVLLNSAQPESSSAIALAQELSGRYAVPVMPVNCMQLTEFQIKQIISQVLFEFPIREVSVNLPSWIVSLDGEHWLRRSLYQSVRAAAQGLRVMRDTNLFVNGLQGSEHVSQTALSALNLSEGSAVVELSTQPDLFYKVLAESTGLEINDEQDLLRWLTELSRTKASYDRIKNALDEVDATGYGIVMPSLEELRLEEPELMRQGGRYGVRLRASAPSLHIMKANITTEVAPIVGSESQSEELVMYLLNEFEENPAAIWESNIFGKSLHELVNEGLHNKLYRMPGDARLKFQETIEKVINEGCSGLICIIL
ncbi:MAG: stage IV sporulation protein A [Oscillospiraceae bacterium]|jgi:stage IV sporulation protein A|nr:stage IV sporulation protein A [Oscillospiraceae bacterium]